MKRAFVRLLQQCDGEGGAEITDGGGEYEYREEESALRFRADGAAFEIIIKDGGLLVKRFGEISYLLTLRPRRAQKCELHTAYGTVPARLFCRWLEIERSAESAAFVAEYTLDCGGEPSVHTMRVSAVCEKHSKRG